MTPEQFFNLVAQMRRAQRNYAKTGSTTDQRYARDFERRVDAEISRVQIVLREKQQPKLTL